MQTIRVFALALAAVSACAWDAAPHRLMTRAALDSLPPAVIARFGAEARNIPETYCLLPDRYVEIAQFGFARNSPGPRTAEELRPYCVRPDGRAVHSATFDRDDDLGTLIYLFERMLTAAGGKKPKDMAMYAGVLAHFIEDSLSPPHSVMAEDLAALSSDAANLHGLLERSFPGFTIAKRTARAAPPNMLTVLESIVDRLYAGADRNRKALPDMVRALELHDAKKIDDYLLRAGKEASELLADTLCALLSAPPGE